MNPSFQFVKKGGPGFVTHFAAYSVWQDGTKASNSLGSSGDEIAARRRRAMASRFRKPARQSRRRTRFESMLATAPVSLDRPESVRSRFYVRDGRLLESRRGRHLA